MGARQALGLGPVIPMPSSSRERMLDAWSGRRPDQVPCCFMIFSALSARCEDHFTFVQRQLEMGLDAVVALHAREAEDPYISHEQRDLPGLPVRFHPSVRSHVEVQEGLGGSRVLRREYETPAGTLATTIQVSRDWPHGDHIPFLDDWILPRSTKHLVTGSADLAPLAYLLRPPALEDVRRLRSWARRAHDFADKHELAVTGGWGAVGDAAGWLCGLEPLIYLAHDDPGFVEELVSLLARWNACRMKAMLEAGVDLFVRRGWYEGTDFWSPRLYERFLLPSLKAEAALAHEAGALFGYIMTTGSLGLLDMMMDAGVDVLVGVDPVQGRDTELTTLKTRAAGRLALWGGVNGFLTVERGSEEEVREAVRRALATLGPEGFVLSPVDNVTADNEVTRRNVAALIDEWQAICGHS